MPEGLTVQAGDDSLQFTRTMTLLNPDVKFPERRKSGSYNSKNEVCDNSDFRIRQQHRFE